MLLEIIISDNWAIVLFIALLIAVVMIRNEFSKFRKKITDLQQDIGNKALVIGDFGANMEQKEAQAKVNAQQWALGELEKYKNGELEKQKKILEDQALNMAAVKFIEWKTDEEEKIRKDAAKRSIAVHLGKITEHLLPFSTQFKFNPKDTRFIGSPIDLIVFDGLTDKRDDVKIVFIEIKTGNSALTDTQRRIWLAIERKNVAWLRINMQDLKLGDP